MPFEVEVKVRLQDPAGIEAKAKELGSFKKEVFKEDIYFRPKGDNSTVPADRYRLRREAGQNVVTFKRQISTGSGEVNDEVEFTVDSAHAFFKFADRFGFEPFVVKRKKSRVYRVGRADVELNEVEHLGHFAEIEILCDEEEYIPIARTELARLLNKLGINAEDIERTYYILMIQEAYPAQYRFVDDESLDWPFEELLL